MKFKRNHEFAFVTFLMLNDNYLPGALMLAYGLRKQKVESDLICMVTDDITPDAHYSLNLTFDYIIKIKKIFVPHKRRQERQDRPFWFTRLNALKLGQDGDLGFNYKKIVLLDADVLPLKDYESLFQLNAPAGIINEDKSKFAGTRSNKKNNKNTSRLRNPGKWGWHQAYDRICPHGHKIPKEITDRVTKDVTNMGMNGSLFVIKPSMKEFLEVKKDIMRPDIQRLVGDLFDWPDMQYLTMRWSGQWVSVDVKYSAFKGYPCLSVLNGTHYAGIKPWYFKRNPKAMKRYSQYEDFQFWFKNFKRLLHDYPKMRRVKRLRILLKEIEKTNGVLRKLPQMPKHRAAELQFPVRIQSLDLSWNKHII